MPTVLVSAEHERQGVKHDASSVWVEDLTTISFKICIRELQNFDGAHQSIHVVSNCPLVMCLSIFCVFCGFRQFYCNFVWPIESRVEQKGSEKFLQPPRTGHKVIFSDEDVQLPCFTNTYSLISLAYG